MLTFLNSFLAWALLAATLPILIHLFTRKKLKVIPFSTIRFLQAMQKEKIRQVRLRQWILLLLRTLIILLVVMAFMRPTLKKSSFIAGQKARTASVIILDSSLSMSASFRGSSMLDFARRRCKEILDQMQAGDEVSIVTAAWPAKVVGQAPLYDAAAAWKIVESIEQTSLATDFQNALSLADRILAASRSVNKEIYLLSDRKQALVAGRNGDRLESSARLFVLKWPEQKVYNLTLAGMEIENQIFEQQKPVEVRLHIQNTGSRNAENRLVHLYLNDRRVAQKQIQVEAGKEKNIILRATPTETGYQLLRAELEKDDIPLDNARYGLVHIPDSLRVLLIGQAPRDRLFVRLALNPSNGSSGLRLTEAPPRALRVASLEKYDVVLLSNLAEVPLEAARKLEEFLEAGGGLVVFLGNNANLRALNQTVFARFHLGALGEVVNTGRDLNEFMRLGEVDYKHPIFQGVFEKAEKNKRRIDSPLFQASVVLRPDRTARMIMRLTNNAPFLIEQKIGQGRVLAFMSSADGSWSDLPQKGIFVPLIYRAVRYAGEAAAFPGRDVLCGVPAEAALPGDDWQELQVIRPDGAAEHVRPRVKNGRMMLAIKNTAQAGFYHLQVKNTDRYIWAANFDPEEMRARAAGLATIQDIFHFADVLELPAEEQVDVALQKFRIGTELWQLFLAVAFFLLLVEMLLYRAGAEEAGVKATVT